MLSKEIKHQYDKLFIKKCTWKLNRFNQSVLFVLTVSADYFYKVCQPFVSVHSFDQIYHFKLVSMIMQKLK